jgi:hypothetical protein
LGSSFEFILFCRFFHQLHQNTCGALRVKEGDFPTSRAGSRFRIHQPETLIGELFKRLTQVFDRQGYMMNSGTSSG